MVDVPLGRVVQDQECVSRSLVLLILFVIVAIDLHADPSPVLFDQVPLVVVIV